MTVVHHERFGLSALSRAAGVTPRTVRYYVQQGVLPSPGARGPGAHYDRRHLERLQLIKRLQAQHLPLAEIRKRLQQMDDAEVRSVLVVAASRERGTAASDYVRQVLRGGAAGPISLAGSGAAGETVVPEQRSQWERITLAPDVELHVRRPLSRWQNRFVERLLDVARGAAGDEVEPTTRA